MFKYQYFELLSAVPILQLKFENFAFTSNFLLLRKKVVLKYILQWMK